MRNNPLLAGAALGVIAAVAMGAAAQAQELGVKWKGAPEFANDDVKFKVRGRVYMDYVGQEVDGAGAVADSESQNSRIRTARLGVEGQWNSSWAYKAEVNFAGNQAVWEDLILEYKPTENISVLAGNFKIVSLENITSSRYTTFMERGAFNDLIDAGRVMNLGVKTGGENWTAAVYASGDSLNDADVASEAESAGVNGRVTFAPILTDSTQVHLGGWARYRDRGGDTAFSYRNRNNTNVGSRYVDTGAVGQSDTTYGLEAALVQGPFSVQGEYARVNADAGALGDREAQGYYVYGSWFVTGESRTYEAKKGEFGRTKILNPVTAGGPGAWELGVRYDATDYTDFGTSKAGEYSAWTAGATWYPFPYVRFMANYTAAQNDNPLVTNDVDVNTFQMRAQFDF